MRKTLRKIKRAWAWYVKGEYHCDKCPYSWEEWCYEGDADAGCYIKGDICDTCRLLPPLRFLIGWPKKKQARYADNHAHDGIVEWYEENERRKNAMKCAALKMLAGREVCYMDYKGDFVPMSKLEAVEHGLYEAVDEYEELCHPITHKTLRQEWKELLQKTWERFADKIRPYIEK